MEIALGIICILLLLIVIYLLVKIKNQNGKEINIDNIDEFIEGVERIRRDVSENNSHSRQEISHNIKLLGEMLATEQERNGKSVNERLLQMEDRLRTSSVENEQKLNAIRETMERRLSSMQQDNNSRLEKMQNIVDEKLQKTLEERMTKSFMLVNERLEQVYKGLGEMQSLASGVGDLKKVLSNVKTRGTLGEIQLGAIFEQIMAPEQYERNVITKSGTRNPVEYAVKIPKDDGFIYLPVDSKFPLDAYSDLINAYETGSKENVDRAANVLMARIKAFAKDISDKYIDPPNTTDFAIMFLPTEGLYAEVVSRGMIEVLQRDYHVNIAGPSNMAVMLNSLQMGFRSFAIQKRSGEVWQVLGAVKTEFEKFADALEQTQKKFNQANDSLETLIGVRTRQMNRKLKDVQRIPADEANKYLEE